MEDKIFEITRMVFHNHLTPDAATQLLLDIFKANYKNNAGEKVWVNEEFAINQLKKGSLDPYSPHAKWVTSQ